MAAMAVDTPEPGQADRLPIPSRNPLPLSASQEAQVRDIFYARVRSHCADEIKGMYILLFRGPETGQSELVSPDKYHLRCRDTPYPYDQLLSPTLSHAFPSQKQIQTITAR